MNLQQFVQPTASSNGYVHRRVDNKMGGRTNSKIHSGKPAFSNSGSANGGKIGGFGSPSQDRLIYVMTYLIGYHVEVHVKNGSIVSGIFHAANPDKDFGIVLKMAQVVKDGSVRGQKPFPDTANKFQTMIIPASEFVQVLAKDVSLSSDEFKNRHAHERRKDLMIDSAISHSHHIELERELERWTPDKDDVEFPELDSIFDGTWNRNWDQFETNETLFGVKSTFDEELYTTRLERGPHLRDLEREASRIAREIEGEETHDQHLAEERGTFFNEDFDLDEESKYSAVCRDVDDGRFQVIANSFSDARSIETFGDLVSSVVPGLFPDISKKKVRVEARPSSTCSSLDSKTSSRTQDDKAVHLSGSIDHQLTSDCVSESLSKGVDSRLDKKQIKEQSATTIFLNEYTKRIASEEAQASNSYAIEPTVDVKGLSASATAYDPCGQDNKKSSCVSSESTVPVNLSATNELANQSLRSVSYTSSISEHVTGSASNAPGLSPSSSVGSLSYEKLTLNPYAKEFKLNPNAKSFTPSASLRAKAPVSEGSFYYTGNISVVPQMHNLPIAVGFGPSYGGHQPVYNAQGPQMQASQAYIPPNGPLYGQQMIVGQPRPVYYMPTYQPEMAYKGRNF